MKKVVLRYDLFHDGGGCEIRTHAPLPANGFQDRLVVTASIFLRTNQQNYSKKPLLCQAYDSSILFKKNTTAILW